MESYPEFIQTIFVGVAAFAIPFLWHIYSQINETREHLTGDRIKDILTRKFYAVRLRYFNYFIYFPSGFILLLGLIIFPLLLFNWAAVFIVLSLFYFLSQPFIFEKIKRKTELSLSTFLQKEDAESSDVRQVFSELWQKEDSIIEKEFGLKAAHIFNFFAGKIDILLSRKSLRIARTLLEDFRRFLNNRSTFLMFVTEDLFQKILGWHYIAWKNQAELISKEEKINEWSDYGMVEDSLTSMFELITERALIGREAFIFFKKLKEHVDKHQKEHVGKKYYASDLFDSFYRVFFEKNHDAPERFDIWTHYFPGEWKVTKNNLEDLDNIVSNISLEKFVEWADPRIWRTQEEADLILEEVSSHLFPEVEPIAWSRILIFARRPYGESRIKSMVEVPWSFGFFGRIRSFSRPIEKEEKQFNAEMQELMNTRFEEDLMRTFELVYSITPFADLFKKENLEKYIKELETLDYPRESREAHKKDYLINLFKRMATYVEGHLGR